MRPIGPEPVSSTGQHPVLAWTHAHPTPRIALVHPAAQVSWPVVPAEKAALVGEQPVKARGELPDEVQDAPHKVEHGPAHGEGVAVGPGIVAPVAAVVSVQGVLVGVPVHRAVRLEIRRIANEHKLPVGRAKELGLKGRIHMGVTPGDGAPALPEVRVDGVAAAVPELLVELHHGPRRVGRNVRLGRCGALEGRLGRAARQRKETGHDQQATGNQ